MVDIAQIRVGLRDRLLTISGLRALEYVPPKVSPPMACVSGPEVRFDDTMGRGSDDYTFPVLVLAQKVSERGAQAQLDAYLNPSGPSSIKAAIEADETLGGIVDFAWVREVREYGAVEVGEISYLGATFLVEITASA
jgi:hypothetical protein